MSDDQRPALDAVWEHYAGRILNGRGEWAKATCALNAHEDRNASASVNVEAGKWRCFSCDISGDVYDLIGENEGVGFAAAKQFAEANFERRGDGVRAEPSSRSGLPGGSRSGRRKSGPFVPVWRRL